jgi:putative sterol carrier protein
MATFRVPEDVSVDAFFSEHVPSQYGDLIAGADLSSLKGKEITIQFDISGKQYCLKIKDGSNLEVIKGGIDKPMLTLSLTEQDWRDSVTGKIEGLIDQFTDPAQIADVKRLNTLSSTKGACTMEIKKSDGSKIPFTMIFNGEDKPSVTLNLDLPDWIAMQKKETTGQALFMNGKLKFTGDMVLLMKLQTMM